MIEKNQFQVLLIEDNLEYARLMEDVLVEYPVFRLSHAVTLKQAFEILETQSFQLILLDLNLGDSRGLETYDKIHQKVPKTPVIILTGLNDEALALVAVGKGAQDYVVKGLVDPPWIVRMMRYAIERKRAEDVYTQEQSLLQSLMETTTDSVYFKDDKSRFIRISMNQARRYGLRDPSEAVGKTDFDFFSKEHAEKAFADEQKILKTGEPLIGIEEKLKWPDNRVTWVSSTKMPLRDRNGKVIGTFGISRNITELKLTAEQLQAANEELKETQMQLIQTEKMQSVGILAAGVAHEVKNPLAIIQMGTEYLSSRLAKADPTIIQTLSDMQEAVKRADTIVRELVDYSASRKLDLQSEDVNQIVDESLVLIRHELVKTHTYIIRDFGPHLPRCMLDRRRIQQVMINLFMNSLHAMKDNGELFIRTYVEEVIPSGVDLHRSANQREPRVIIEIRDTGTGIPEHMISKVFDPFFTVKPAGEGSGLGLSIAQRIVDLHGGKIEIRNRKAKGVCVTITLKPAPTRRS